MGFSPVTTTEKLMYSTSKILTEYLDGTKGSGTGFFYQVDVAENRGVIFLVTNRHVIEGGRSASIRLHTCVSTEDESPSGKFVDVVTDCRDWRTHENPDIDLCAVDVTDSLNRMLSTGVKPFFVALDRTLIPTAEELRGFSAIEDVVMVGYPNGISDEHNNLPVFRRGSTASHPAVDFEGKTELLVDIACFPGSSGSPLFVVSDGAFTTRMGIGVGGRAKFLGVLYAGPTMTATGKICSNPIPTVVSHAAYTQMMIHLGYFVKSAPVDELCQFCVARPTTRYEVIQ